MAAKFTGQENRPESLLTDERPRALELLNFVFSVRDVSLACVTHFARHRMQSPLYKPTLDALARGNYVLPETVATIPKARAAYEAAFREQADFARDMVARGLRPEDAAYCALSGHTADLLFAMNARELLHFFKLRTCERAQWEIRAVARQMLRQLRACEGELFGAYGPSCLVTGPLPRGAALLRPSAQAGRGGLMNNTQGIPRIGLLPYSRADGSQYFPQDYLDAIEMIGAEMVPVMQRYAAGHALSAGHQHGRDDFQRRL